jgi:hypothetical protein
MRDVKTADRATAITYSDAPSQRSSALLSANIDPSFSLGEVLACIRRLPDVAITPRGGRHFLMELLRRGELVAHIVLPGRSGCEVRIPPSYWARVGMAEFRGLAKSQGPGAGSFFLEPWDIPDQIADAIEQTLKASKKGHAVLRELMSSRFAEEREVYIRQSAVEHWLREKGHALDVLMQTDEQEGARPGRKRGDRERFFRGLCRYLLHELSKRDEAYKEPKHEMLAEAGRSEALKMDGSSKLPSVATLKKEIPKLLN